MSPPKPIDSEDIDRLIVKVSALTDASMQLANAVLNQSQAQNRLVPLLTNVRNDVHELLTGDSLSKANLELRLRNIDSNLALALRADLGGMATNIALIRDNIKDVQGGVTEVHRDVTNSRIALPVAQPEDKPANGIVASMREFDRLPTKTKLMILFAFVVVGFSGWLRHLLSGGE